VLGVIPNAYLTAAAAAAPQKIEEVTVKATATISWRIFSTQMPYLFYGGSLLAEPGRSRQLSRLPGLKTH
jgi:hypothetical protein